MSHIVESSRQGLQLHFGSHFNLRFAHKVMGPQSRGNPNFGNFETPKFCPGAKCHLDVGLMGRHRIYYKREGGDFPQIWAAVSLVSLSLPVARPSTKNA
jgi:hypothetical protein